MASPSRAGGRGGGGGTEGGGPGGRPGPGSNSGPGGSGSGGVGRGRALCKVPQEIVTPTRRDIHANNIAANIDWLPVSEYNSRSSQNRVRKLINSRPENGEYVVLDSNITTENSNRFVPVRPQPRTLVLRQRDTMLENQEDSSFNAILGAHSPHTSHTAVMIVNPTTPNANQSNQNMTTASSQNNGARNNSRSLSGQEGSSASINTVPVGPYPTTNNKSNNISSENHEYYQNIDRSLSRTRAARIMGENLVTSCPETSRVEQQLGQIQEYIRVTATLVDNMRNSEDELRKQLTTMRRNNQMLMEDVYQDVNQEPNSDIEELMQTLNDLKDSEKKLKEILDDTLKVSDNKNEVDTLDEKNIIQDEDNEGDNGEEISNKNDDSDKEFTIEEIECLDSINESNMKFFPDILSNESEIIFQEAPRSCSVQSVASIYSDNELWQNELEAKMEVSQMQLAAALQEQKYILKCQAEAKEQLLGEMNARHAHLENSLTDHSNEANGYQEPANQNSYSNIHQPLSAQTVGRTYASNQIGVATTLPHISEGNRVCRTTSREIELAEGSLRDNSEALSRSSSTAVAGSDLSELDMLRDLQMRRQHLESQVVKIQNLQAATASLAEAVADSQSGLETFESNRSSRGPGIWEGSEDSMADDEAMGNLRSNMAAVNVVKVELERLKDMLRTVDSIQNNFGLNSISDDDHLYENGAQAHTEGNFINQNSRSTDPSFNNTLVRKTSSPSTGNLAKAIQSNTQIQKNQNTSSQGLSRLQNYISSGPNKCTNVNDQQQRSEGITTGLASIQQLTQQMKQEVHEINEERRRLKQAINRDVNSSGSSIKSDDKKRTNSLNKRGQHSGNHPASIGPIERKQLALQAELEAKKKQLERLMSKEVDHRTNQQSQHTDPDSTAKSSASTNEKENTLHEVVPSSPMPQTSHSIRAGEDACAGHVRSEADNGYSSDQDEDDEYSPPSNTQLNINQMNGRCSRKLPSQNSSPDNLKAMAYGDSAQSLEHTMKHNKQTHSNIFSTPTRGKQRNKEQTQVHNTIQDNSAVQEPLQEHRLSKDIYHNQLILSDNNPELKNASEACHSQRGNTQERENHVLPVSQTLVDCHINMPGNSNVAMSQKKQQIMRDSNVLINRHTNLPNACSRPDSGSSSGDQELTEIPHPMPALSFRHSALKNEHENNPEVESQQWFNPGSESQVTMWWHNKANQLQQQLEMTSNLCQSLLQDRQASQSSPSTLNSLPQAAGNPNFVMSNYPGTVMLPYGLGNPWNGAVNDQLSTVMHQQQLAIQQQQLAVQQQQLAATSWGNTQCIQHLLTQQREISSLKSLIGNLEEKVQMLNVNLPRSHSTPPITSNLDNSTSNRNARSNSSLSRSQPYQWSIPSQINPSMNHSDSNQTSAASFNVQWLPYANRHAAQPSNLPERTSLLNKKTPVVPPYPIDHSNNQIPINFCVPALSNEHINSHMHMPPSVVPNNLSIGNQPSIIFNNCSPPAQLNPNLLNNQSISHTIQNNVNPNSLLNLSPHMPIPNNHPIVVHPISSVATQTMTGQNTALNNQVPPGNRANNYWDNFRSYSRQNLLSGSNKINSEATLQTHSPHPLVERSHNPLHSGSPIIPQPLPVNTPKRNVNNQLGHSILNQNNSNPNVQIDSINENITRGRRNLSNESGFSAPPDVLNVNQNLDSTSNQVLINTASNVEEEARFHNSVNLNINKCTVPDPEIAQANPNLNLTRSNGAHKKKSSSKLPAKNASNTGNFATEYVQNKNVHSVVNPETSDLNIASASSANMQKSTSKLFDLLRENVYSEVSALISANESRPHFLIQLFRDLQQISSDTLRQRTLQSIQELVTRYLASIETESYGSHDDQKSNQRVTSTSEEPGSTQNVNDLVIFTLDTNNEITKFLFAHNTDICNDELLQSLKSTINSVVGSSIDQGQLDQCLFECFNKYPGCKLMDISNEMLVEISKITAGKQFQKHPINESVSEGAATTVKSFKDKLMTSSYSDKSPSECRFSHIENAEPDSNSSLELASCLIANKYIDSNDGDDTEGCSHHCNQTELKMDLIENVETCNGDLAEADQSRHPDDAALSSAGGSGFDTSLPDIVDMDEQTPTEAEAEWLRMDRVTTRLETEGCPGNQSGKNKYDLNNNNKH